jgi:hypothetical protein
VRLTAAKVVKGIKIIFIKHLAGKKRLCIFALGLSEPPHNKNKTF